MSDQSKKPRADEHTEGRPLDLSPLLYPELSSEAEREALLKALERDEEARAQLAQLELARRLIEERAAHRAERLGAEVSLSQAQRANVLEVARAQARRARARRDEPREAHSLAHVIGDWLLSPQLAWAGALTLMMVGVWRYQTEPEAPLSLKALPQLQEEAQGDLPLREAQAQASQELTPQELTSQQELTTSAQSEASKDALGRSSQAQLERPASPQGEGERLEREPEAEVSFTGRQPSEPTKARRSRRGGARAKSSEKAKKKKGRAKPSARPKATPPSRARASKSAASTREARPKATRPSKLTTSPKPSIKASPASSQDTRGAQGRAQGRAQGVEGAQVGRSQARSYAPPPPPPPPAPPVAQAPSGDVSERGEAASAWGAKTERASEASASSDKVSSLTQSYAPPPPPPTPPTSSSKTIRLEDSAQDSSAQDSSAQDSSAQDSSAQGERTQSAPWGEAVRLEAQGRRAEALVSLEAWLNQNMSHSKAAEGARLGERWARALKDMAAVRRFIAYRRALEAQRGSGGSKQSAPARKAKRRVSPSSTQSF